MHQGPCETVAEFSHRLLNIQHELSKHIPNIHLTKEGSDIELQYALLIKLRREIKCELVSRKFKFKSVQEVIECAKRFEVHSQCETLSKCSKAGHIKENCPQLKHHDTVKPKVLPISPKPICKNYNKFEYAYCELPHNKCKFNRIHKCLHSSCGKIGCKLIKHSNVRVHATTPAAVSTESHVLSALSKITDTLSQLSKHLEQIESSPSVSTVTAEVTQNNQAPRSDETFPIFGMPAFTTAVSTNIDLSQKTILWAKVESAGVAISLPIDSCCSVSLVSEAHANHVMEQCPTLTFERLPTPIPVTVVSPDAQLKAIGTMQIPIKFGPGAESLFVCLVVPCLCWLMLFCHNPLQSTHALVDHGNLQIACTKIEKLILFLNHVLDS